jgi:hypothetical protein
MEAEEEEEDDVVLLAGLEELEVLVVVVEEEDEADPVAFVGEEEDGLELLVPLLPMETSGNCGG